MNPRKAEIEWYRKNGKYPDERITQDSNGVKYVEGDFTWNLKNKDRKEFIEPDMKFYLSLEE